MATTLNPSITAHVALIPTADDFQVTPGLWWHTFAEQWAAESGTAITGRSLHYTGDAIGDMVPGPVNNYCDATVPATPRRQFDIISGSSQTQVGSPYYIALNNTSSAGAWEIKDHTSSTTGLTCQLLAISQGQWLAADRTGCLYVELAADDPVINYRIAREYGKPTRLDVATRAGGWVWQPVAVASSTLLLNTSHNDEQQFVVLIMPDNARNILSVEVGNSVLRHSPAATGYPQSAGSAPNAPGALPTTERYRVHGVNYYGNFQLLPMRFAPLTVRKSPLYPGFALDVSQAQPIVNLVGTADSSQLDTITVTQNSDSSIYWTAAAQMPDAGDGLNLGSSSAPSLADVVIYVPSQWAQFGEGWIGQPIPQAQLNAVTVAEEQIWDDANRLGRIMGTITLQNSNHAYDNAIGNYALTVSASNGSQTAQRLRGVMGFGLKGIESRYLDPLRYTSVPFSDFFIKMDRPIEQELVLDGLCLSTAIRILCDIGQISPQFLQAIPEPLFPPYPANYPEYVLPRGSGLSPRMKFMPQQTVVSAILEILRDAGYDDPITGLKTPYYINFDPFGQLQLQAYNPAYLPVVKNYSTADSGGAGQIVDEPMIVSNSVEQIRTNIALLGQDAYTYELLQYHVELPWNYGLVGWRRPAVERNARYATVDLMARTASAMITEASLGVQIVRIKVPFDPNVFAGNVVSISDSRLGTGLYSVIRMTSLYGLADCYSNTGEQQCYSWLTCRSLINNAVPPA